MSIYEYDEEKHMRQTREEGWEDGKKEGIQQTKLEDIGKMMKALGITAERAMEILEIPENEQAEYLSRLQK